MNYNPIPMLANLTAGWSDEQFRQLLEEMTGRVAPTTRDECVEVLSEALQQHITAHLVLIRALSTHEAAQGAPVQSSPDLARAIGIEEVELGDVKEMAEEAVKKARGER